MLQAFRSRFSLYWDFMRRLRFYYTHFEKWDVELASLYADYAALHLRKLLLGTRVFVQALRDRPGLAGESAAERDRELLTRLAPHELFLFPAHAFYPATAKLTITTRCNFRCGHCFQDGYRTEEVISLEEADLFLRKCHEGGIRSVSIFGGEPFLYPERVFDIIALAEEQGMRVHGIVTNGYWCSSAERVTEYLQRLKSLRYRGSVCISVGAGHEGYFEARWFKGLKERSREILGRNIFYFTVEEVSYEKFLARREALRQEIGDYHYRPMLIAQVGGGVTFARGRETVPTVLGRCCGLGLQLLPSGETTFCLGPGSLLPEYATGRMSADARVGDISRRKAKLTSLISGHKGDEIAAVARRHDPTLGRQTMCDLCMHLARNERLLDAVHEELECPP